MADNLDRKALIIYLDDIRTMEMIIYQSKKRIERLKHEERVWEQKEKEMEKYVESKYRKLDEATNNYEYEKNNLQNYLAQHLPNYPNKPILQKLPSPKSIESKTASLIFTFLAIFVAIIISYLILKFIKTKYIIMEFFMLFLILELLLFLLSDAYSPKKKILYYNSIVNKNNEIINNYNQILENCKKEHKKICENALKKVEKAKSECNKADREKENFLKEKMKFTTKKNLHIISLKDDINLYSQKRDNAYDANIIPKPFRDLYGAVYLYDYISTSNESFSNALLHYNLETIKAKLTEMIDLEGEQIILQMQTNAHLEAIRRQNDEIIETAWKNLYYTKENLNYSQQIMRNSELAAEYAENTMNNSAIAAQYQKIAATNSELTLELQERQLAYQAVDFWLNKV